MVACTFCCLSDSENTSTLQTKLQLPAPTAVVGKPRTDVPTKTMAVDDGDNVHSSLLAGMLLVYFMTIFFILHIYVYHICYNVMSCTELYRMS